MLQFYKPNLSLSQIFIDVVLPATSYVSLSGVQG